ncbi:CNNM domain-containing protein [Teredinibacter franksiae]|uniref:CNNM domain-containing protein n=1 Tax=Teredinibacter franksiae TaxID=2761453 RepID=UPI00162955BD|nr:CNNM domain-containing protein [Teredinibacter franksiae]
MALLLFYLALALCVSFLCSVLEAVLLSVTPSYIASEQELGSSDGTRWAHIKANIDRTLAAILSLNTIAHTIGAAGVGAQAASVFGEAYFGVISAILTLLILVFSEIIPKTLGANYWKSLAPACLRILKPVEICMWPLVVLSQGITGFFSRKEDLHMISRDEIAALAWMGEDQGVLNSNESAVVRSIMRVRTLTAKDIMTPRTVIFSLDAQLTVEQALKIEDTFRFSRIPLYDEHSDKIRGLVRKDDILAKAAKNLHQTKLKNLERELLTVLSNKALLDLLQKMSGRHFQMCLVVNEFGDTLGIATMEDVVETMLGLEIVDETDNHPDMQKLARSLWLKRAKESGLN